MSNPWLLEMMWNQIGFAHWRAPLDLLAPLIPPGWELDTFDGEAWLSVVPFVMEHIHLRGLPVTHGFGYVPELNLRTYARRGTQRAVRFFSLDAASAAVVHAARITTGLPYFRAEMKLTQSEGRLHVTSRRRTTAGAEGRFRAVYHPTGEAKTAAPQSLEAFLHERYLFVTPRGLIGEVRHEPYRLHAAQFEIAESTLGKIIGLDLPSQPDLAMYAESVRVRATYQF